MKRTLLISAFFVITSFFLTAQEWEQLDYTYAEFLIANPVMGVSGDNMKIGTGFTFDYAGPMELSIDGGSTWTDGINERIKYIKFDNAGNIYVMDQLKNAIVYNGSLYKSSDNGLTWEELLDVEDYTEQAGFKVTRSGEIYVPTYQAFKYSADHGVTWQDFTCPNTPYGILRTSSGRLIITTYNSGIHFSDDNGSSWTQATGDLGNITFGFLQEHPSNGNIYVSSGGGVLESTDNGASFFLKAPNPWVALNIREFEITPAGEFYFYGLYGVYTSTDAVEWTAINDGLPAVTLYDMDISNDHIYVVAGDQIYRRQIEEGSSGVFNIHIVNIETSVFPNPSKGYFHLDFTTVKHEKVSIAIMDMTGSIIHTEEPGILSEGNHQIPIQLNNLPTGIYIVTVQSASGIGTQRIEILR